MQAQDVMTTDVATVARDTPVEEIAKLLLERQISAVPVIDEDRRLLGNDAHGHAEVDFSDVLDPAWIDVHIDDLRARGRLPGS